MALRDEYNLENLVNETERMVFDTLEKELVEDVEGRICRCQDCILDIAALALNSVKPLYRVSLIGRLYAGSVDETVYADRVRLAVRAAIDKITANPSH